MVDYRNILENLGYKLIDRGSYWHTAAIFRNGDNPTAIQIYKDTGVWRDFVEDSPFAPFEALVKKTLNTNDSSLIKSILNNNSNDIEAVSSKKKLLKEERVFESSCLKRLLPHYDFYTSPERNISIQTLEDYQCGLATSGKFYQRLVFPIFRYDGKIHGFSGRKILESNNKSKWFHSGKVANWVYPTYTTPFTSSAILNKKRVFLVESIGDSLAMYDKGIQENLVSFGLSISPKLAAHLGSLEVEKIVFAFNNDFEAEKNRGVIAAVKNIIKLSSHLDFTKIYICPPHKSDFGKMTDQKDFELYLKYFDNMTHEESMRKVVDQAEALGNNVSDDFKILRRKFNKLYSFHYE